MPLFTPLLLISCLGLLFASSDVQQLECPLSDLLFAVAVCNPRTAKLREFVMQWPNTKLNTLPRDIRREIVDLCDDVVECLSKVNCRTTQEQGAGFKKTCSLINVN